MFKILFSSDIDLNIFENGNELKNIKKFDLFTINSIVIDKIKDNIYLYIYGKSKLYKRKLKGNVVYENCTINIIKDKIEEIIDKEILSVNSDLEFLSIIIPKLNKYKDKLPKDKLLIKFKNEIKRFINIVDHTYIDICKSNSDLYYYLTYKNYFM